MKQITNWQIILKTEESKRVEQQKHFIELDGCLMY